VPSIERRPSPRDALSGARLEPSPVPWRCCPDHRLSTPLHPARRPCGHRAGLGPRPRTPLPAGSASRGLGVVRRLLQPFSTRGHTLRAIVPRARVGLASRYSPASTDAGCVGPAHRVAAAEAGEPRSVGASLAWRTLRLRGRTDHGPGRSSEGVPHALDETVRALLVSLRAPGSPARLPAGPGMPCGSSPQPRPTSDAPPRRVTPLEGPGCFRSRWNPYASQRSLADARPDQTPLTPPPQRNCSGWSTPLVSPRGASS